MVKQFKFLAIVICLFFLFTKASAQRTSKNVKDTASLVEGVFTTKEQFLKQHPASIFAMGQYFVQ